MASRAATATPSTIINSRRSSSGSPRPANPITAIAAATATSDNGDAVNTAPNSTPDATLIGNFFTWARIS